MRRLCWALRRAALAIALEVRFVMRCILFWGDGWGGVGAWRWKLEVVFWDEDDGRILGLRFSPMGF